MSQQPQGSGPACRYCRGRIAKATTTYHLSEGPYELKQYAGRLFNMRLPSEQMPKSLADCRRLVNEQVVSVRYWGKDKTVRAFSTWDRVSYEDQFFCSNTCAIAFAYVVAREWYQASQEAR